MPFVPVPGVVQVDVIYLWDSQRVENTMYFEKGDGWSLADIEDLLDNIRTFIGTELLPSLTSAIQLIELIGRLLDTASSIGFSLPINPPESGSIAAESMPNNVTYTVSLKTGLTGRSFRGRNYVPGMHVDAVTGNTVTSGFRSAVLNFYTALLTWAAANGTPMVVVSRYSGVNPTTGKPIPRTTGVATPIVSVTTFDSTVDSQRRRLPGRGR